MRLFYKSIWGTVVISELQFDDKQCTEIAGNFGRETIQGIVFEIFLM